MFFSHCQLSFLRVEVQDGFHQSSEQHNLAFTKANHKHQILFFKLYQYSNILL